MKSRTLLQTPEYHLTGQSTMLQNCCLMGGGCGQKELSTVRTLLPPCLTSWMQETDLVWMPPPQDFEQTENSVTFHLGGQGWSLQVRTSTSGRSIPRQLTGATGIWDTASEHTILVSYILGEL